MTQNCTIYINSDSIDEIVEAVESVVGAEYVGSLQEGSIHYANNETSLNINRMIRLRPGDDFSKLIMSTHNFAKGIECGNTSNKDGLLKFIFNTKQIFGVVAEPEFDDFAEELIFSIAEKGNGVIFTGNAFLNAMGGLVLDLEGNSDEGVDA